MNRSAVCEKFDYFSLHLNLGICQDKLERYVNIAHFAKANEILCSFTFELKKKFHHVLIRF